MASRASFLTSRNEVAPSPGPLHRARLQLFAWLRTDDPDLRITCQTSSIPIAVSPGTVGMQPKLSINDESQGGNGPSQPQAVNCGVNFDANGRFALDTAWRDSAFSPREAQPQSLSAKDNQRQRNATPWPINGADGADGTECRLEFDPTSRIRSSVSI